MAGSSTPWKATSISPKVSTVWLACARERRGYLWCGLRAGGSTLGGGNGGGLGGRNGGAVGGTLGGAWGSVLSYRRGSCIVARVRLGGGVGVGVGALIAAKMSASCRMASMVWAPKQAKDATGAGFARASDRPLSASMAASEEDIAGMALLQGKTVLFWRCAIPMSPVCKCGRIDSGLGLCRCTNLTCHGSPMCTAVAGFHG